MWNIIISGLWVAQFRIGVMFVNCYLIVFPYCWMFYCCVSCIAWIVCDVDLFSCLGEIADMLLSHFSGDF